MSYYTEAQTDAKAMIEEFKDEIIQALVDSDEASDDLLNDYGNGDSYHHESHVDKEYDLSEANDVLNELRDYEETDSGLWDSLGPREAISAQAAYTYGNAVYSMWRDMVKEINSDYSDAVDTALDEIDTEVDAYTLEDCRQYLTDNTDCDFTAGELDKLAIEGGMVDVTEAVDAIKEHKKEAAKKRVATATVDGVTV